MSYKFKGEKIIIGGNINKIVSKQLPQSPINGYFCIDSSDNKFKVYSNGKWVTIGSVSLQKYDTNQINNIEIVNFEGNVSITNNGNGKATILIGQNGFGGNYNYASSESLSSTTSTTYQNKVSLQVSVPVGKYHIGWSYEWKTSKQGVLIKTRIYLDDTTYLSRIELSSNRNNITHSSCGFKGDVDLDGEHKIDLDYCSESSNNTVYIGRARLELWRVS